METKDIEREILNHILKEQVRKGDTTFYKDADKMLCATNNQISENNNGIGIIGNNVYGGGINDGKIIQDMVEMLKKKDEQIDKLLQIIQNRL